MAKQQQSPKGKPGAVKKPAAGLNKTENSSLFQRFDQWIVKREQLVFWISMVLCLLFALLLFDMKIHIGGDDSGYVERSYKFIHGGEFPLYQGAGYPLVLTLPLAIFGLNMAVAKLCSVFFALGHVFFMWKAFRNRIPNLVLYTVLYFIAVNSFVQAYSSLTYTEAFFMFMQAVALYFTMQLIDKARENNDAIKHYWGWILVAGIWFLLLSLSKSIAFVCFIPVLLYFLFQKQFRTAAAFLAVVIIAKVAWEAMIRVVVGSSATGQLNDVLLKDMYKPELGSEDLNGLWIRFWLNVRTFFSIHIYRIIHFRSFATSPMQGNLGFGILTGIVLLVITFLNIRKNKYIFFTGLYVATLSAGVFVGIQANNLQDRLIIIAVPLLLVVFLGGLYQLASKVKGFQFAAVGMSVLILGLSLFFSVQKAGKNIPVLKKNLAGDIYYGFTPDWVNYLKMSEWCGDSLPEGSRVLVRKGNMSYIASRGSEKFYGWTRVPSDNPDTLLAWMKHNELTHVMIASLRSNPSVNDNRVINTIHRIMGPVQQKYPEKFTFIRREGETEPADLYKINY